VTIKEGHRELVDPIGFTGAFLFEQSSQENRRGCKSCWLSASMEAAG